MSDPLVSIIMPVYNAEPYIHEAISSVLSQTHKNWELLIVNDGSTDRSKKEIQLFLDQRIQYYEQDNRGVSAARNVGLEDMKGDFFCFLDADDFLTPKSIESRVKMFYANEDVEFVDGKVIVFDTNSNNQIREYIPQFIGNPYNELISISESCFFGPTWMIKRKRNKIYLFKDGLTHAEDLLFYISISRTGNFCFTEETIYNYRAGNKSAMSNLRLLEKGYFEVYNEIRNDYSNAQIFKKKVKSILYKSYLRRLNFIGALRIFSR